MELLLTPAAADCHDALFSDLDVGQMMQRGITSSFFTLDEPDATLGASPFQEAKWGPTGALAGTDYLGTLLFTDYLLKMMSCGAEVNCCPPFALRRATTNFMRRLPPWLRRAVLPVSERDGDKSPGAFATAHRFWIELGEVGFWKTKPTDENPVVEERFWPVKMRVKKHLLRRDEAGNLVDADEGDDSDTSREADFARYQFGLWRVLSVCPSVLPCQCCRVCVCPLA